MFACQRTTRAASMLLLFNFSSEHAISALSTLVLLSQTYLDSSLLTSFVDEVGLFRPSSGIFRRWHHSQGSQFRWRQQPQSLVMSDWGLLCLRGVRGVRRGAQRHLTTTDAHIVGLFGLHCVFFFMYYVVASKTSVCSSFCFLLIPPVCPFFFIHLAFLFISISFTRFTSSHLCPCFAAVRQK